MKRKNLYLQVVKKTDSLRYILPLKWVGLGILSHIIFLGHNTLKRQICARIFAENNDKNYVTKMYNLTMSCLKYDISPIYVSQAWKGGR